MRYKSSAVLLVSGLVFTAFANSFEPEPEPEPEPYAECWRNYEGEKRQCGDLFNDPGEIWTDALAYRACLAGAEENLAACTNGLGEDRYSDAWSRFITRLKNCVTENAGDEAGRESCVAMALLLYQTEINDLLFPDGDGDDCLPSVGDIALANPMYALRSAAVQLGSADGKYPVAVNTTLTFSAGINASPGAPYDVGQVPCVKSAIAIAVYTTKSGPEVVVFDADTDTADGVSFDLHLIGDDLVDTNDITLISVFYDERAVPLFSEIGALEIQDSPISGDWNRDEVLNTQDVIDFLDSYNAQTKRADVTNDGVVDSADAVEFTEDYTE